MVEGEGSVDVGNPDSDYMYLTAWVPEPKGWRTSKAQAIDWAAL